MNEAICVVQRLTSNITRLQMIKQCNNGMLHEIEVNSSKIERRINEKTKI